MKRVILIALSLLVLGTVLALGWLLTSESGLRFAFRQVQPALPGALRLQQISGTLTGGIELHGVEFIDTELEVTVDQLLLQWNPWALLRSRLEISSLEIGQLNLKIDPTSSNPKPAGEEFTLPQLQLPLSLQLQRLSVDIISLRQGDASYHLQQLLLEAEVHESQLQIERFDLRVTDFAIAENERIDIDISLEGGIEIAADYRHALHIDWQTRLPGGAAVNTSTLLEGDLKATRLTQQLSEPLQARLTLDLQDPLRELRWQASLQASDLDTSLLVASLPALRGAIELSAEGDLQSARVSGQVDADSDELGKVNSRFELSSLEPTRLFEGLRIESLKLALFDGEITGAGMLYWTPALSWESEISASHINPVSLLPEWPGDLNAALRSTGRIEDGKLSASVNIAESSGSLRDYPFALQGIAHWQEDEVEVESANISSGNTRVLASGKVGDLLDLQWSIDSRDLAELYPGAEGQLQASGHLGGRVDAPFVEAKFQGKSLGLDHYTVATVDGDIAVDLLNWQRLDITFVAQDLDLQGQQLQSVEIVADKKRIDARLVAAELSAQIRLAGELRDQSWRGKLLSAEILSADYSTWRLQGPVALDLSADNIVSEPLCLVSVEQAEICSSIQGNGQDRGWGWDINLELARLPLPLLQQWTPPGLQLDGIVDATADLQYAPAGVLLGKLDATLPAASASYPLQQDSLERFDYRLGKFSLILEPGGIKSSVALTLENGDQLQGRVEMPGASILDFDNEGQAIRASAKISARNWAILDAMIPQISKLRGELVLDLSASGSLVQPRLQGNARLRNGAVYLQAQKMEVTQIELNASSNGSERVEFDASAMFAQGRITLRGNTVLQQEEDWPSKIWLDANGLEVAQLLAPWIEPPLGVDGLLDASAELDFRAPDHLLGKIDISLPRGSLNYPLVEQEKESWEYRDGFVSLSLEQDGVNAAGGILVGPHSELKAQIRLAGARLLALDLDRQPMEAETQVKFEELELIEFLVPDIDQVKGQLLLNVSASGSLAQPLVNARAQIPQGSFRVPRLGLEISQVELQGSSSDDLRRFEFELTAHSGEGDLSISGNSHLDPASGWPTTINVKGSDFEVSRIPEALVTISPDLQITLEQRSITITGDLLIPLAKLQPKDVSTAARVSNDTVIIGGEQEPEEKWLVTTRVNLALGDKVTFFGFGFEGRLGGKLLVEDVPGELSIGTGEITIIEGRYRAYGQRLDINNGRLLFTGSALDNPGLDLRAYREVKDVTVGLQVRGRLQQPQLDLFSTPSMGETDMLSYLLFGRPMEGSSGTEGEMMAKAALALGLAGGDNLARQLGDQFGFDEMRVESDSTGEQASLVVGRYLAPKLYVSYGVGLVESVNKVNVRYELTDHWKLEAESGIHQGADILYSIER